VVVGAYGFRNPLIAAQYEVADVTAVYLDMSTAAAAVASQSMTPPKFVVPMYASIRALASAGTSQSCGELEAVGPPRRPM
jgi:hypothetical protein